MDLFLKSDTNVTTSTKPIPICFSCHQPGHIVPNCPSRKPACPNFLGLQHQIHPLHYSQILAPNSKPQPLVPQCHQNLSNYFVVNSTAQVSALQDVPLLPIDATAKVATGPTLVDSAPLCMLPLRTAQPTTTDLDSKSLFNPIPTTISTPVNVNLLHHELRNHLNQSFVSYLLEGFTSGFNICYTGERFFPASTKNLLSALNNRGPVSEAISKELSRGHIAGLFASPPFFNLHCFPLGCVPKRDGLYRLIIDLPFPPGRSVNENIPKDSFSVVFANLMMQ